MNRRLCLLLLFGLGLLSGCSKVEEVTTGFRAVQARGRLRAAMSGRFPPFNFYDASNQLVGFDVDIAKELARRLGLQPELKTLQWDGILAGLQAGRYDAIIGSMAITPERQEAADFTDPYYRSGAQVFARPEAQIESDGTLSDATMGVNLGTTYEKALRALPGLKEVRTYSGIPEILVDVEAKRLDGFVTDRLVGLHAIQRRGTPLEPRGELLYTETIAVALQKGQPRLKAKLNHALSAMRRDGTYAKISKRWFGRDISTGSPKSVPEASPPSPSSSKAPARGLDFSIVPKVLPFLLQGLGVTLWISLWASVLALALGQVAAFARRSESFFARVLATIYVDFFRGTPILIQLFAIYFGAPQLGIDLSPWAAGVLGIALNYGAYTAEILRASLDAVPKGQWEAGRALGMGEALLLRRIILPQSYRIALPPLVGILVALIKDTSLVSTITVVELTRQAQIAIGSSFRAVELYGAAALLYLLATYPLMRLSARWEKKLERERR